MAQQQEVITLFERMSRPLTQEGLSMRGATGAASKLPADAEINRIRQSLDLPGRGIGITPRGIPCSLFKWETMEEANKIAALLVSQKTYDEFFKVSAALRGVVNEELYVYGNMSALLAREDTRNVRLPPVEEVLPYWYFSTTTIQHADNLVKEATTESERVVVDYEFAHNERDPEFRVAYFREDIALNSHHWHWHIAYPFTWEPSQGGSKDRKGELFYYMHQQVVARYDIERLCNDLPRVRPLSDFDLPMEEGYFPNLSSTISGTHFEPRTENAILRDTENMTLERMTLWKNRVLEAIHMKFAVDATGENVPLAEPRGIDILSAMVESAALSVNRPFYGEYHNVGHRIIARVHDPQRKFNENVGVMSSTATAMRDPIFYRWHKDIDNIFLEYKQGQPMYTRAELTWADVRVHNVNVRGDATKKTNFLQTFLQQSEILLSSGVDFGRLNPVFVRATHLQHEDFVYEIEVENTSGKERDATVRLFLAPVSNELRDEFRQLDDQRILFCELDKYQVKLKAGKQVLSRRSQDSNVTLEPARSIAQLAATTGADPIAEGFCGCGWPEHLLIPKGRPEGMRFILFAMLTNWNDDKVETTTKRVCGDAASYCGIRDQKYPDKRNMGFPFDRRVQAGIRLSDFLTQNMKHKEIIIRHSGEIVNTSGVFEPAPII